MLSDQLDYPIEFYIKRLCSMCKELSSDKNCVEISSVTHLHFYCNKSNSVSELRIASKSQTINAIKKSSKHKHLTICSDWPATGAITKALVLNSWHEIVGLSKQKTKEVVWFDSSYRVWKNFISKQNCLYICITTVVTL